MRTDTTDVEGLAGADAVLRHDENSPAEKTACEAYIRATLPPELAVLALAALGLTDPYQPLPGIEDAGAARSKRVNAAVHGTGSGHAWHLAARVPLCRECRAWGLTHQNGGR